MMNMGMVVVILALAVRTYAEIREPGLRTFCNHISLDVPGGLSAADRQKDEYCEQKFSWKVENDREAMKDCLYMAPFDVKLAKKQSDHTFICQWQSITTCDVNHNDKLIRGKCFYLGSWAVSKKAASHCERGSKLHNVRSPEEARWISILMDDPDPIHVANIDASTNRELKYNDKVWDGFTFSSVKPTLEGRAILMRRNDLNDVSAGTIIAVDDAVQIKPLCVRNSREYQRVGNKGGGMPAVVKRMNLPEGIKYEIVGSRVVVFPSNVYQPTATSTKKIDTKHFHDVCKKLCDGCYAALPDMTSELAKHKRIVYVPARHTSRGTPIKQNYQCQKDPAPVAIRGLYEVQTTNGKLGQTTKTAWQKTYPDNMCADTLRTAVVADSNGKVKDSPVITRHPLVCVKGNEPGTPLFSLCGKNAVQKSDGTCECKPKFTDIRESDVKNKNNVAPGRLCLPDAPCETTTQTVSILFVLDKPGGHPFSEALDFIEKAGPSLPPSANVGFTLYGRTPTYTVWIDQPWTQRSFKSFVRGLKNPFHRTETYSAVNDATDELKSKNSQLKFMILITDEPLNGTPDQMLTASKRVKTHAGARLIMVPIASQYDEMKRWVQHPDDYIDLSEVGISNLSSKHWVNIMSQVCEKYTFEDFVEGAQ